MRAPVLTPPSGAPTKTSLSKAGFKRVSSRSSWGPLRVWDSAWGELVEERGGGQREARPAARGRPASRLVLHEHRLLLLRLDRPVRAVRLDRRATGRRRRRRGLAAFRGGARERGVRGRDDVGHLAAEQRGWSAVVPHARNDVSRDEVPLRIDHVHGHPPLDISVEHLLYVPEVAGVAQPQDRVAEQHAALPGRCAQRRVRVHIGERLLLGSSRHGVDALGGARRKEEKPGQRRGEPPTTRPAQNQFD
eukprot:scaffold54372_cov48-Phaeocystis_antarctica.AAC.1